MSNNGIGAEADREHRLSRGSGKVPSSALMGGLLVALGSPGRQFSPPRSSTAAADISAKGGARRSLSLHGKL
ncbi:hypothetical protein V2A60_002422 [Cordyceps javanica]